MTDTYRTEEEQIEALKKWWQDNGKSLVIGVALGLAVIFAYRAWTQSQHANIAAASAIYDSMVTAATATQGELTEEQVTTANHLADTLIDEYGSSTYAEFARLYKAQLAVKNDDYEAAATQLQTLIDQSKKPEMVAEASLRLARVYFARQQYAQALELLGDGGGAARLELKGDILLAQEEKVQALTVYQEARSAGADDGTSSPLLALKIQELSSQLGQVTDET